MKLFRHSLIYLLSRGIPALLSIATLVVFTRLLDPAEYGLYILIAAATSLMDAVLMQWLYWSLVRFSSKEAYDQKAFEQSLINAFFGVLLIGAVTAIVLGWVLHDSFGVSAIAVGYLLFVSHSWYSLHLQTARAELRPAHFGVLEGMRSLLGFAAALIFIRMGMGALGLVLGMAVGRIIPTLLYPQKRWWRLPGKGGEMMRQLLHFGLPLGISTALAFVINLSDRIIIGAMMGESAAGLYGAGYDLVLRAMVALMTVMNLASYPLVVKTLEEEGEGKARDLLRSYFTLFVIMTGGMALGMALLASELSNLLLGEAFRAAAIRLIPIAALGIFFSGIRTFYFNYAFQLSKRTMDQIWVSLLPALLNVYLVIRWLPVYGIQGAIYASVVAFGLALLLSIILGYRAFVMPVPFLELGKTFILLAAFASTLWFSAGWQGVGWLMTRMVLACGVALLFLFLLNPAGMGRSTLNGAKRLLGGFSA